MNHSNDDIKPFFIKLTKLIGSIKSFGKVKFMSFMLEDKHGDTLNKDRELKISLKNG